MPIYLAVVCEMSLYHAASIRCVAFINLQPALQMHDNKWPYDITRLLNNLSRTMDWKFITFRLVLMEVVKLLHESTRSKSARDKYLKAKADIKCDIHATYQ